VAPVPKGFASLIVAEFPALVADITRQLRRIVASDFHVRCDGHATTLMGIEDTDGLHASGLGENASRLSRWQERSEFEEFSLHVEDKNSHNFLGKRFVLKAEQNNSAL
jgi:hypothetical protein